MVKANEVIERIMVSGVEADIIKEVQEEAPIEEVSSKDL
jgi:hypothetical protein